MAELKKKKTKAKSKTKAKAKAKAKPKRSSAKTSAKKKSSKKAARKPAKKSVKKTSAKKKTQSRSATRKPAAKAEKVLSAAAQEEQLEKQLMVEPGPPTGSIPPVEEPAQHEEAVAVVTHYYSHLGVAVVQVNKGSLRTGDQVHIKGHTTDFTQQVASLEYEHQHVDEAGPGQSVGLKVSDHAREHDIVYVVR